MYLVQIVQSYIDQPLLMIKFVSKLLLVMLVIVIILSVILLEFYVFVL